MTPHEIVRRIHAHAFGSLDRCQRSSSITAVDVHIDRMPVTERGDDVSTARRDSRRDRRHRAEPGEAHRVYCVSFQLPATSYQLSGAMLLRPGKNLRKLEAGSWKLAAVLVI